MATESSGFDEAMDVGTSTISHLKALKTASTITKAGFGAAGGPFTTAVGIAIANRHGIAKIIIVIIAILLLPVLFILMLPGLIFGSNGARYIRISLCCKDVKLAEALERIKNNGSMC